MDSRVDSPRGISSSRSGQGRTPIVGQVEDDGIPAPGRKAPGSGDSGFGNDDDSSFLSPGEVKSMMDSLEQTDARILARPASTRPDRDEYEGSFISPADIERKPADSGVTPAMRAAPQSVQSDLLTRIAGELRTIKSELGSLKQTYDSLFSSGDSRTSGGAGSAGDAAEPGKSDTAQAARGETGRFVPSRTFEEIVRLFGYLDKLLESLPEEKIDEFARSEYFDVYRRIFEYFKLVDSAK